MNNLPQRSRALVNSVRNIDGLCTLTCGGWLVVVGGLHLLWLVGWLVGWLVETVNTVGYGHKHSYSWGFRVSLLTWRGLFFDFRVCEECMDTSSSL